MNPFGASWMGDGNRQMKTAMSVRNDETRAGVGNLMGPRRGYISILRKAADLMRGSSGGGDVI